MFGLVNFVAEDVSDYQFLDKSWLEQVLESVLSRNLLSLSKSRQCPRNRSSSQ